MVAPSGTQHEITAHGYRAVVTECGAGLRRLSHEGTDLVQGFPETATASSGRGQLLIPWPNRIRDGRYIFEGSEQQLPLSEAARGNASHGLVRWTAWTQLQREDTVTSRCRLMAQSGYPWTLDLEVVHALTETGLRVSVTAVNRSECPAPYALGAHPYLTVGGDDTETIDDWELTLPARTRLLVDEQMIPTGSEDVTGGDLDFRVARRVGETSLDTAFTDLERTDEGLVEVLLHAPASGRTTLLWADQEHRWLQAYTGDDLPARPRTAIAVEPMTSPPNAFATGVDLLTLAPAGRSGDTHTASWGIRAG